MLQHLLIVRFKFLYILNIKNYFLNCKYIHLYTLFSLPLPPFLVPFLFLENISGIAVTSLENSQILHADEAGSVTLPIYSGDQTLTPVCILYYIVVINLPIN